MDKTLAERLSEYSDSMIPMHMPGHKRNTALSGQGGYLERLSADLDITEVEGFDNLASPDGILKELAERASALWGSKKSFILTGGSTLGILASVWASIENGDKVICARNCHKSVYNALRLREAEVSFIMPRTDEKTLSPLEIRAEELDRAFSENKGARLFICTSPTYEGVISDISALSAVCRKYGAKMIVDEAHGAHFGLSDEFPQCATALGADIAVSSLHKTLPALTQSAILHVSQAVSDSDIDKIKRALSIFSTSSPSYIIMASIDGCIRLIEEKRELLLAWKDNCDKFFDRCSALSNLEVIYRQYGAKRDFSKIIISSENTDISGGMLASMLRERGIEPEMESLYYVLAMTGMGDKEESINALADALFDIDKSLSQKKEAEKEGNINTIPIPKRAVSVCDAEAIAERGERKRAGDAIGEICLEYVWAYPPGVPTVIPGEMIDEALVTLLSEYAERKVALYNEKGEKISERIELLAIKKSDIT